MTAVLEPIHDRPPDPAPTGIVRSIREFDLLDRIGTGIADMAGVQPAQVGEGAPRLDADLLKRAGGAILRNPWKHPVLLAFAAGVAVFSLTVFGLLVTGHLDEVYEAVWRRIPGRQWTHVMREHPWIYLALAVPLAAVPFALAPPQRWGRAFLTYVIFLIGFLGGHVFW